MKRFIFLLITILPCIVFGQKAKIEFKETSYNFGTISERGGKVNHEFVFQNTGSRPLILTNVRAGCGCTTPEWSRKPIAPGETGSIKVSFDPRERPGSFVKSIIVNSNASNAVLSLTIRGKVSRKPAGPYDAYNCTYGPVKMEKSSLNLGTVKNTQIIEKQLEIINTDKEPVTVEILTHVPYITARATPTILQEGQKGHIEIKYDVRKRNDWGFVTDELKLKINNEEEGKITVVANITEDFSGYQGDFTNAPVISFSEIEAKLSDLPKNSHQKHEFYIQNNGKSVLDIRKIKTSDESITVVLGKNNIKPGKKTKVTINFNTGHSSQLLKLIQFITNDPENTFITYKLNGNVK